MRIFWTLELSKNDQYSFNLSQYRHGFLLIPVSIYEHVRTYAWGTFIENSSLSWYVAEDDVFSLIFTAKVNAVGLLT